MTVMQRWEQFWFENVPSEVFALVRIAIGAVGVLSLIGFVPVDMFWFVDGIAPLPGGGLGFRSYLLEAGLSAPAGWIFFLTLAASFTCMTVGLFTGTAVVTCFLGSVLQTRWNWLPVTSGHTIMVAVLFCLVWADCGGHLSVDAWLRRRRSGDEPVRPQPIWPLRLIRAQVAVVYGWSGFFKLLGAAWRDGSAVHYTVGQNVYGRIFHAYTMPASLDWTFTILTYLTLAWELTFPFLLWNRTTRAAALLTGVGMHLGILITMEVGPFSWVMLATYVAFLDPHTLARLVDRLTGRLPMAASPVRPGIMPDSQADPVGVSD